MNYQLRQPRIDDPAAANSRPSAPPTSFFFSGEPFLLRRRCLLSHPHSCSIRFTEFGIARSRLLMKIDREIRGAVENIVTGEVEALEGGELPSSRFVSFFDRPIGKNPLRQPANRFQIR
ncbi:hypothetical protein LXL04_012035 [Taraxacum kok-saghyz]